MKTAPHIAVGLTACAALAAGYVLATDDGTPFDAQQTQFQGWVAEAQGGVPAKAPLLSSGRLSYQTGAVFITPSLVQRGMSLNGGCISTQE